MRFASRRSPSQHQMPKRMGSAPKWMGFSPRGSPPPSLWRMGFASRGSPSLSPRVSLLQVDEILLRGFPLHSEWDSLQGIPLLNSEWDSHQEGHPLQENGIPTKRVTISKSEWDSHQEGHPLQSEWDSHQKGHPLQANGIRIKRVTLSKQMGFASRGSPSPKRMGFASNVGPSCSKRPLSRDSSPRPRYSRDSLSPKGFASASKRMVFASRDSHSPKQQRLSRGTQILLDDAFIPSFVS